MNLLTETFGSSLIQNGLNFFFPLPPYSQKQFIVQFLSNLCYLVKEGWEVRGPDRGHVCPVAGATPPLLGMGVFMKIPKNTFAQLHRSNMRTLKVFEKRLVLVYKTSCFFSFKEVCGRKTLESLELHALFKKQRIGRTHLQAKTCV